MKIPVIIDTDPGHDDALAIMLAVKSNLFKVHAITTVSGNSTIENTTRNARFILKLLNREDIPVYSGAEKPLNRDLIRAVVHGSNGLEGLNPTNEPGLTRDAVDRILSIIEDNPDEVTLITLGPLTNVAKAMLRNPEIMMKLKQIVIMGGAIKVPGNQNRVAEFNIFVDPEAASIVLKSPVKKVIIPLDACNHVRLSLEDFKQVKNERLNKPLQNMIKPYIKNISIEEGVNAALMYDPLTVYSLINPEACEKKEYNILIETKGDVTRGMVVPELRDYKGITPNVTVIERISAEKFKKDFINILSS